jgi:hypothetical protein
MLPIAAPVTAPAVCFGIGGTWISSDDGTPFFFSGFGWSGINGGLLNIFLRYKDTSDDNVNVALTKLEIPVTLIGDRHLTPSSRDTVSFSKLTMKRRASPCASATKLLSSWPLSCKTNFLKQAEQFEDDYDDNDYSNYVEDVSVHAVTDIRLSLRWPAFMQTRQYSQRLQPGLFLA